MKIIKSIKTRKDTRWKRGDIVVVEILRKQNERKRWWNERNEKDVRYLRLENTPDGRVVSSLSLRDKEK